MRSAKQPGASLAFRYVGTIRAKCTSVNSMLVHWSTVLFLSCLPVAAAAGQQLLQEVRARSRLPTPVTCVHAALLVLGLGGTCRSGGLLSPLLRGVRLPGRQRIVLVLWLPVRVVSCLC